MSDDVKPATYNLRLIYLRAFFSWCMEEGYLSKNPLSKFKKQKASPRIVDIPDEELQKLLNSPDLTTFSGVRDYALIMLTLDTGIRPSEAFGLTYRDFDLKHFKIRPYDLRHAFALRFLRSGGHAFALRFLRSGGHAFALQRILGHTDMSMTRRYIHLTADDLQEAHRVASPLNRLLAKKKKRMRNL